MENNCSQAKTEKKKIDKRKLVTKVVTAAALAFIAILLWLSIAAVDSFDYVTIAFDGARPFLIPRVEVSKKAPKSIKASDFTFSSEYSRKKRKRDGTAGITTVAAVQAVEAMIINISYG